MAPVAEDAVMDICSRPPEVFDLVVSGQGREGEQQPGERQRQQRPISSRLHKSHAEFPPRAICNQPTLPSEKSKHQT